MKQKEVLKDIPKSREFEERQHVTISLEGDGLDTFEIVILEYCKKRGMVAKSQFSRTGNNFNQLIVSLWLTEYENERIIRFIKSFKGLKAWVAE